MRDEILLSQNYEPSELKCYLCDSKGHILETCRRIHFVLDKVKVATKFSFSVASKNRTVYERKRKIKINSRYNRKNFKEAHEEFLNHTLDLLEKQEQDEVCEDMESENKNADFIQTDSMKTHKSFCDLAEENETVRKSLTPTPSIHDLNGSQSHSSSLINSPNLNTLIDKDKKNEENELDKIMRDFEKIKNFCYFYPTYNIEAILSRLEIQKKKTRRLVDRKSPKNRTNGTPRENKIN